MKWGIDVSEHNQPLSWQSLKRQGASFVIVRLGWGKGHLDSRFYEQVNGVLAAGLELGIYYYSYALTGELFSCVKPTLDECREARDEWLTAKEGKEDRR